MLGALLRASEDVTDRHLQPRTHLLDAHIVPHETECETANKRASAGEQ
jgi:hypothetical protein